MNDLLRQVFDAGEPVVVRMRHEPHAAAQRLLVGLGAGWIVDPVAPPCARQCGHEECRVSAVATRRWCRMYGCGDEPEDGSEFCSRHQHAAGEPNGRKLLDRMDAGEPPNDDLGLGEAATVGERAVSGAAMGIGEPERAAASSSPEPEPELEEASDTGAGSGVSSSPEPGAVPAQTPAGDGAVDGLDPPEAKRKGRNGRWTREAIVAAIRAEAERTGFVPQQRDWGGPSTDEHPNNLHAQRVFGNWGNAIEAAGYPRPRRGQKRVALNDSEREPQAAITSRARGDSGLGATVAGASSRSEHDRGARVKVPGTGLTYRTRDEALIAADEIEADGERVAEQALADGNGAKADQAAEISRELAKRIRAAAEKRAPNIHETIRAASDLGASNDVEKPEEQELRDLTDDVPPFQRALARALIAGMRAAADALEQELGEAAS